MHSIGFIYTAQCFFQLKIAHLLFIVIDFILVFLDNAFIPGVVSLLLLLY